MKIADVLSLVCIVYIFFGLTPFLLMNADLGAHYFGHVLVIANIIVIEILKLHE